MKRLSLPGFAAACALLIATAAVRFYDLGGCDLWLDETVSLFLATSPEKLLVMNDEPFLFHWLLCLWTAGFGFSESALRALPACLDLGTLLFVLLTGLRLLPARAALWAAALYAFNPLAVWYAREARNYSLSIFCALGAFYFFVRCIQTPEKKRHWLAFLLFLVLGLQTTFYLLVTLPVYAAAAWFIFGTAERRLQAWSCIGLAAATLIPYAALLGRSADIVARSFWTETPNLRNFIFTLENFALGYTASDWAYLAGHLFFTLPLLAVALPVLHRKSPGRLRLILAMFLFPWTAVAALSFWFPVYLDRKIIFLLPFYLLLIASFSTGIRSRSLVLAGAVLLQGVSLAGLYRGEMVLDHSHRSGVYAKKPIRPLVDFVARGYAPGESLLHTQYHIDLPFYRYGCAVHGPLGRALLEERRNFLAYDSRTLNDRHLLRRIELGQYPGSVIDVSAPEAQALLSHGVWLLQSDWDRTPERLDENSAAVRRVFLKKMTLEREQWIEGVLVSHFVPTIPAAASDR